MKNRLLEREASSAIDLIQNLQSEIMDKELKLFGIKKFMMKLKNYLFKYENKLRRK